MAFRSHYVVASIMWLAASAACAADSWQLVKYESGIKVYLQAVPGSPYKAYRGVTLVNADMQTLRRLMDNPTEACAWIHECAEQRLLKQETGQAWTYTRFNAPWPVRSRDSIVRITEHVGADGSVRRDLRAEPDYLPAVEGCVRVTIVDGFWQFSPRDNKTEVTYQVHMDPGGSVPSWLANKFVVEAPFNTLRALRERAQTPLR